MVQVLIATPANVPVIWGKSSMLDIESKNQGAGQRGLPLPFSSSKDID
jgi:hypothetical protein